MRKSKMFSKALALCLGTTMLFGMSVGVSAATVTQPDLVGATTGTFTVSGFETTKDITVNAYKIINVNIDDTAHQPVNPVYTWATAELADWVRSYETTSGLDLIADAPSNDVTSQIKTLAPAEQTKFLEAMALAIRNDNTAPVNFDLEKVTKQSNKNTSIEFAGMKMGEYLLDATGGAKIYKPTTVTMVPFFDKTENKWVVGPATGAQMQGADVVMKGKDPQIKKEGTTNEGDSTVKVGDIVTYKLTVDVPSYPTNVTTRTFTVGDKMSEGLTFQNDIKVFSESTLTNEIPAANYGVNLQATGKTFEITFNDNFWAMNPLPTQVFVTYTAKVNEKAFGTNALGNTAFIGYNNDPYNDTVFETDSTEKKVYTYGINVAKLDKDGKITLSGAEFTLTKKGDTAPLMFVKITDGVYIFAPEGTPNAEAKLIVAPNGELHIQGLDEGTYVLKETKAPDGYVLPNGTIEITITDKEGTTGVAGADGVIDGENVVVTGSAEVQNKVPEDIAVTGNVISFKVLNTLGDEPFFELPKTGGMGTVIFTVAGILLMAGAVVIMVLARKKRA